ncbi:hypothetical protein T440DRAFT_403524 [Plenodomus tracheiphilus IPT5]|uniref:Uncharacterized protein n=1 Tax=Plenodomus tracheiphilus IPT5 TaxID=1408161 RepID=A0A6A7AX22_9PLEO|nr:hypothetical protein T440DRAFT_403524 [Plenodomus tracheiphilus IPT5]
MTDDNPEETHKPEKREEVSVILCNDLYFHGYCQHFGTEASQCVLLDDDLNKEISSVAPDVGSYCYFFTDCKTNGDTFHVGNPGFADLRAVPVNGPVGSTRNFNNRISSYFCVHE